MELLAHPIETPAIAVLEHTILYASKMRQLPQLHTVALSTKVVTCTALNHLPCGVKRCPIDSSSGLSLLFQSSAFGAFRVKHICKLSTAESYLAVRHERNHFTLQAGLRQHCGDRIDVLGPRRAREPVEPAP